MSSSARQTCVLAMAALLAICGRTASTGVEGTPEKTGLSHSQELALYIRVEAQLDGAELAPPGLDSQLEERMLAAPADSVVSNDTRTRLVQELTAERLAVVHDGVRTAVALHLGEAIGSGRVGSVAERFLAAHAERFDEIEKTVSKAVGGVYDRARERAVTRQYEEQLEGQGLRPDEFEAAVDAAQRTALRGRLWARIPARGSLFEENLATWEGDPDRALRCAEARQAAQFALLKQPGPVHGTGPGELASALRARLSALEVGGRDCAEVRRRGFELLPSVAAAVPDWAKLQAIERFFEFLSSGPDCRPFSDSQVRAGVVQHLRRNLARFTTADTSLDALGSDEGLRSLAIGLAAQGHAASAIADERRALTALVEKTVRDGDFRDLFDRVWQRCLTSMNSDIRKELAATQFARVFPALTDSELMVDTEWLRERAEDGAWLPRRRALAEKYLNPGVDPTVLLEETWGQAIRAVANSLDRGRSALTEQNESVTRHQEGLRRQIEQYGQGRKAERPSLEYEPHLARLRGQWQRRAAQTGSPYPFLEPPRHLLAELLKSLQEPLSQADEERLFREELEPTPVPPRDADTQADSPASSASGGPATGPGEGTGEGNRGGGGQGDGPGSGASGGAGGGGGGACPPCDEVAASHAGYAEGLEAGRRQGGQTDSTSDRALPWWIVALAGSLLGYGLRTYLTYRYES